MGADIRSSPPGIRLAETNSEAQREAKEDSTERHEQELTLALELDRELNSYIYAAWRVTIRISD